MGRAFALLAALAASFGVAAQVYLTVFDGDYGLAGGLLRYVSYMSNWHAVAAATVAWATLFAPQSRLGGATARLALVPLVVIVMALYEALLRGQNGEVVPLQSITTDVIHDAVPVLFVLMWLTLPHPGLPWRAAAAAMILPFGYLVFGMGRGLIDGFWGYWFLNLPKLGTVEFVRNSALILLAFGLLGLALVALDRHLARRTRRADLQHAG